MSGIDFLEDDEAPGNLLPGFITRHELTFQAMMKGAIVITSRINGMR